MDIRGHGVNVTIAMLPLDMVNEMINSRCIEWKGRNTGEAMISSEAYKRAVLFGFFFPMLGETVQSYVKRSETVLRPGV